MLSDKNLSAEKDQQESSKAMRSALVNSAERLALSGLNFRSLNKVIGGPIFLKVKGLRTAKMGGTVTGATEAAISGGTSFGTKTANQLGKVYGNAAKNRTANLQKIRLQKNSESTIEKNSITFETVENSFFYYQ